ncbi:MAG: hypothetical protein SFU85_08880 [Candidatus Methylacidiphilales bacterium]|nr:hypothetical protein [Candidatus Methylacidiphilales bacterium]
MPRTPNPVLLLLSALIVPAALPFTVHSAVVPHLVELTETRTSDPAAAELRLWIELEGEILSDALEYDNLSLVRAVDDTGANLAPPPVDAAPARLQKNPATPNAPAGKFPIVLKPATRSARFLQEVTGTVTILCYRRQVVLVDRIKDQVNKDIENDLFKTHGLEVRITDPAQSRPGSIAAEDAAELRDHSVSVRFGGKIDKVLKVELETADGKTLPTRSTSFGTGRSLLLTVSSDDLLPPDTRAKIIIPIAPEEKVVPFSLKNIPLP